MALLLLLPAVVALSSTPAQAAGNAGTIKVHAAESPSGTESNEPKVCAFNIEAFGFEEGFAGYITFEVQGGDAPTGQAAGPYAAGTANADGYFATQYFNDADGPAIKDGHYVVTLFGKFNGEINYQDVKAKSKVFKVECPRAPTVPMPNDECEPVYGTTKDKIEIPYDDSFTYKVGDTVVPAGPYTATGTSYTVTAVPKEGVVVDPYAMTTWKFSFAKDECPKPPEPVYPAEPKQMDECEPAYGPTNDKIMIPEDANFTYTVNGQEVMAGDFVATDTSYTVVAVPKDKVVVKEGAKTTWKFYFDKDECPVPPVPDEPAVPEAMDVCEPATGPTNDRIVIPTDNDFTYEVDGTAVPAGPFVATGTSHTVTAIPDEGVVVKKDAVTMWTFTFTKVACVVPPPPPVPPVPPAPPVPPVVPPVVAPVVTPPVVAPPEVLPEQAFGKAVGSVKVTCQGTVRARLANRSGERVVYKLRVGTKVHRIAVKSQSNRRFVTQGKARAMVTLKVGQNRLDRVRIPNLCQAPEVLPDTGLRVTGS